MARKRKATIIPRQGRDNNSDVDTQSAQTPASIHRTNKSFLIFTAVIAVSVSALIYSLEIQQHEHRQQQNFKPEFRSIDSTCRIQHTDKFLTDDEIDHVVQIVKDTGGWMDSESGGPQFQKPTNRNDKFGETIRKDPVVAAIEERVADVTGIPIHPDEDMISVAKITTRGSKPRGGHFPPFGLHHEGDERPYRVRTVLVYLTDVDDGGRTIFPLCGNTPKSAQHAEFRDALLSQFRMEPPYLRHVSFDVNRDHPFNDILTATCKGDYGLSFKPKKGSAILFDSLLEDHATANMLTWHAGCNVVNGTKITLQKFKELPSSERPQRWFQPLSPYKRYVF